MRTSGGASARGETDAAARDRSTRASQLSKDARRRIEIPSGMVHHWMGSVFIPAPRSMICCRGCKTTKHHRYFNEVEESRLIAREGDEIRMFLRLRRKKVVDGPLQHRFVRYASRGSGRASSASYATRIAEIEDAGTAREKAPDRRRPRVPRWRLNVLPLPGSLGRHHRRSLESVSLEPRRAGAIAMARWSLSRLRAS